MQDVLGQEIEVGDWIAYSLVNYQSPKTVIAEVTLAADDWHKPGAAPGPGKPRVEVEKVIEATHSVKDYRDGPNEYEKKYGFRSKATLTPAQLSRAVIVDKRA